MAEVDVLIVHYRSPALTLAAVTAVAGPGRRVMVWDNSGDLPELPAGEVFGDGRNMFFAAGNNGLFARGTAPYVLLLNPDVTVTPTLVDELRAALDAEPAAWGVTARLVGHDGRDQNYLHALPTLRALLADRLPPLRIVFGRAFRRYRCAEIDLRSSVLVPQPPAALLLLRRAQVEAVGGLFDEGYPLFFNDVDLGRRMAVLGCCRYLGELSARHHGGASLRAAGRRGEPIRQMYDAALLRYARLHLAGWQLLLPALAIRRLADRVVGSRRGWWR